MKKLLRDVLFFTVGGFVVIGVILLVLSGIVLIPLMTSGVYFKLFGPIHDGVTGSVWFDKWLFGFFIFIFLVFLGRLARFFHYTGKDFLRFMK